MEKARAVAYIRVSTERDAQLHSYEFQEHYWQSAFEDDPNTDLIGIYADKGISGHSVQKRPKFLVMMQDAREHKFDKIYTKSVSRFARNTTQLLEAVRELRDLGIEVVFENENIHTFQPTSEIFLTIAATIAENDLEVDSARQRWSIQHRCENGWISVGSGLFGLKLTADNELEIVPEEAAVIRYIYESYVDGGIGSKKIADALNAAGVQSRNGYPWDAKHMQAARVKVDEDGVEGAAYTEAIVDLKCAEAPGAKPVEMCLDRPFVFVVATSDGIPLFVGTVQSV